MMTYRKKMIEVALPLEAINKAAAREKSIRHGHPSTLHLWWARRPLAACRAVLFASLVDDPDSDPAYRKPDGTVDEDRAGLKRAELFTLIEELVQWENSNKPTVINRARAEIARCVASRKIELGELKKDTIIFGKDKGKPHPAGSLSNQGVTAWEVLLMRARPEVVNAFLAEHAPPVLDPFCGGGSIPLEAQRLGLRAYGSDLNPVPVLITKALIEIPPKFANQPPVNPEARKQGKLTQTWTGAQGLAEDVRYYGKWMREEAEKRIGHLYPNVKITTEMARDRPDLKPHVGGELTVIAWVWARTVASPNPILRGRHVPLVKSFWLSKKKDRKVWLEPHIDRESGTYTLNVREGVDGPSLLGTVSRKGGRCLITGDPIPFDYIRAEGKAGRIGSILIALIAEGKNRRVYLPAFPEHDRAAATAKPSWVPDEQLAHNPFSLRPPLYGLNRFADLFTSRQLTTLATLGDLVSEVHELVRRHASETGVSERHKGQHSRDAGAYADALATYLAFAVSKNSHYWCALATWHSGRETMQGVFARQAIPMTWDFAECNCFSSASGSLAGAFEWNAKALDNLPAGTEASVGQLDATSAIEAVAHPLISTDPPYYDNIDYADLSDFFYVWLRRMLGRYYPVLFSTVLTPKKPELVATPYRFGGDKQQARAFFEKGLSDAFGRMREAQQRECPLTVYYAFKQAETDEDESDDCLNGSAVATASTGWETMLEGLIGSRFAVTGTWPMRTEMEARALGRIGLNTLASSILLVCRPRSSDAPLATRREFVTELRRELPLALRNLQRGNIAPVDLAQAAIGPGMAVFTRYAKVMESSGEPMTVRQALALINQTLDEVLAEQEGEFDADTRWALAWFEQFGMDEGTFGVAETLSKAKNTAVNGLVEAGVIKARGGRVRLLQRSELPADWDPTADQRLTVWETAQHLIRRLDEGGEDGAAALARKLGGTAEIARDLAYRLYTICERKKWADEALAYNGLVIAWPELTKLARSATLGRERPQGSLFEGSN